jgi:hypothetical protein
MQMKKGGDMPNCRFACLAIALAGLVFAPQLSFAQSSTNKPKPNIPLEKTIGHAKTEVVPSLLVFNAKGANLQSDKLVLNGISLNTIVFADRPVRAAGHDLTKHIIEDWAKGAGNFAKDAVVVLKSPKLDGDRLTFDVEVLEGDLQGADGAAAVFIDIIGRPLTPLSYAGVARRFARRGAWYAGAAAAGAAAAAYYHPYAYGYYHPPCGYYPYPPCY